MSITIGLTLLLELLECRFQEMHCFEVHTKPGYTDKLFIGLNVGISSRISINIVYQFLHPMLNAIVVLPFRKECTDSTSRGLLAHTTVQSCLKYMQCDG